MVTIIGYILLLLNYPYYTMPKYHRGVTYLQTIENTRIQLTNITKLDIAYNQSGKYNTAIRSFIHTRLPILRFHNPTLQLSLHVNKNRSSPIVPHISVGTSTNNSNTILNGEQYSTCGELLKQILAIDGQADLIPATVTTDQTDTKQFLASVKHVAQSSIQSPSTQ